MTQTYSTDAIKVLTGLEPVRRCPGIYTDTTHPNHLGQEVIDNSVDEVLASHVKRVDVILHVDQSLEVIDDGRGMPVDIHPGEGIPATESVLCHLHTGSEFSNKNYQSSGGLHGVGTSVINVLSRRVEVNTHHDGQVYNITFGSGKKVQGLQIVGTCGKRNADTSVHFWPDETFFDSPRFSVSRLTHVLRAKVVLCPGVEITFKDEINNTEQHWCYQDGLNDYLAEAVNGLPTLPGKPLIGNFAGDTETVDWALLWLSEGGELLTESYVDLIPTMRGDIHVNGLRQGLLDAAHKFYEYRNILPCGVKLSAEDIWDRRTYVLPVKMQDPQFAGQTKEHLFSRQCAVFVSGVVRGASILWLNQSVQATELLAEMTISSAQRRMRATKKVVREKLTSSPTLPGKLTDCITQDLNRTELFLVEGDSADESAKQAHDREYQAIIPLKGRIPNAWEVSSDGVLTSQEAHNISVTIDIDPDSDNLGQLRYGKICILVNADSDGLYIAMPLYASPVKHFHALMKRGHVYVTLPPLYCIDLRKEVHYMLTEEEKEGVSEQLRRKKGKPNVQRFKGLEEMNLMQLREATLSPNTRRLVQLTINDENDQRTDTMMDMLLARKRSEDRRSWLQEEGDMAEIEA